MMQNQARKIFIIVFLGGLSSFAFAQVNLVPNPSFELYDTCPSATSPISFATGWESYTDSPDYFNSCSSIGTGYNVPYTGFGYQQGYEGTAYGGIALYGINTTPVREYIGIQLSSPLVIGQKYFVSFQASLADAMGANGWSNKLGAKFTTYTFSASYGDTTLMSNSAQVYSDSLLNDTASWVQIKGSFIADSAYQYVVIGNFFDDFNTDTLNCSSASYAFIDMVCVSTDSLTCSFPVSIENQLPSPVISIYPNPFNDRIQIDFLSMTESYDVVVYNSLGQQILIKPRIYAPQTAIDLSGVANGILMVKILYDKQCFSFKLLKQ